MATLAIRRTNTGKESLREKSVGEFVPYTRHVDPETIATKDGHYLQVLELDGFPFETADQQELNQRKFIRNTMWRGLASSRFAVYYHIVRREQQLYPEGSFEGFAADLDQAWQRKLSEKRQFSNRQYLSVVRRPLSGAVGWFSEVGRLLSSKTDRLAVEAQRATDIKELREATDKLLGDLQSYGARRLRTYGTDEGTYSEVLSFLSYLIDQEHRPVLLSPTPLDTYLGRKRPFFGDETFALRGPTKSDQLYGAMISIKEYGADTAPGMLDSLLALPHELVLTQSFAFIDRQKALDSLEKVQRMMNSADDRAMSLSDELGSAIDATAAGHIAFGEHHLTVLVKGKTPQELDRAVTDVDSELTALGIIAVREDLNLEPAYWAQLPGNFPYIGRRSLISTANFASYASFHNFPSGRMDGNHWGSCVTTLETRSSTPYAFNFHDGDLGNFTVIGPSGTGKTVVMTFLMAQAQRFNPRSVYFDKDRGAEIFIRAIGGQYSIIEPGRPTGFNPLQLADTPIHRAFLRDWLGQLVKPADGRALSASDRDTISIAVDQNFQTDRKHRRLRDLQELFLGHERQQGDTIARRLQPWWGDGSHAWLFDNQHDALSFDDRTTGFDLTFILDDAMGRTPTLMYLFHRVDELLDGQKTIIFIDEGWKALDDEAFEERIKDWLKTIRKRNGLIGFGSQSANDAIQSRIGDAIIEQSPTNIFMPNLRAEKHAYCTGFGLTEQEYEIVQTLSPDSQGTGTDGAAVVNGIRCPPSPCRSWFT